MPPPSGSPGCARARPFNPSGKGPSHTLRQAAATAKANIAQQVRNPFGRKPYTSRKSPENDYIDVNGVSGNYVESLPRDWRGQTPLQRHQRRPLWAPLVAQ